MFNHLYVSHFDPWNMIFTIYISAGYINSLEWKIWRPLNNSLFFFKEEHHGQISHAQKMRASSSAKQAIPKPFLAHPIINSIIFPSFSQGFSRGSWMGHLHLGHQIPGYPRRQVLRSPESCAAMHRCQVLPEDCGSSPGHFWCQ